MDADKIRDSHQYSKRGENKLLLFSKLASGRQPHIQLKIKVIIGKKTHCTVFILNTEIPYSPNEIVMRINLPVLKRVIGCSSPV